MNLENSPQCSLMYKEEFAVIKDFDVIDRVYNPFANKSVGHMIFLV